MTIFPNTMASFEFIGKNCCVIIRILLNGNFSYPKPAVVDVHCVHYYAPVSSLYAMLDFKNWTTSGSELWILLRALN